MIRHALSWLLLTTGAASAEEPVALDTASVEQLASLDHVERSDAEAIVALREARGGRLGTVEALRILPGMDEPTLASLRRSTEVQVYLPTGARRSYATPDDVLAEFAHEPSIQQVHQWASDHANVSPDVVRRWLKASRTFALLPQLRTEYRLRDGWDQDFLYRTAEGADPMPHDEVFDVLQDARRDQDQYYVVRAFWNLDELVMSSERIRVINEAQDVVKLRDTVLSEVTRLYFDRRRLQVETLLSPKRDLSAQVKDELRLLELTANLDALTGGKFSGALAP